MHRSRFANQQRGAALLVIVVTLVIGAAALFYGLTTATPPEIEQDRITAAALATAKAALIGYATSVNNFSGTARPGDLPCPDRSDNGLAGGGVTATSCGNAAGNQQARRLGRLPWKTLGLPDIRDGSGERLWYAVSNNFKSLTRTTCTSPGLAGCLNSDTLGTITVRDSAGNIIHDGTNPNPYSPSGVIAVIIAPGPPLKRQGAAAVQNRTCAGGTCSADGQCLSNPESATPKCNVQNYLDVVTGVEDNADFVEVPPSTNGFISGTVRDASGNVIVNDRLVTITYQDLMPLLEMRVAMETLACLRMYATQGTNPGRYPWANPVSSRVTPATTSSINDQTNTLFGRLPGTPTFPLGYLANTVATNAAMPTAWPPGCTMPQGTWWNNWRDHVFYAVADAYKPGAGAPAGCAVGSCLTVNPPSTAASKEVAVLVAGNRLSASQPRSTDTDKQNPANYLEKNYTWPNFTKQPRSATINDTVVFYPP